MSEEHLEGPETGHPENAALILKEMEIEQSHSFDIMEAETRGRTYDMAEKTEFKHHKDLALITIIGFAVITVVVLFFLALFVKDDAVTATILGALIGYWAGNSGQVYSWFYGTSMSSQATKKILSREISEDD